MYEIHFDEEAIKFLENLDLKIKKRIFDKILSINKNPFFYLERLTGHGLYKLRIGKYRVICSIENKIVIILLIGLRKNIYNKL